MMSRSGIVQAFIVMVAVLAAFSLGGCGASTKPYTIGVAPDASLEQSNRLDRLEVDLIVMDANSPELAKIRGYNLNDYFSGGDSFRAGLRDRTRAMVFTDEQKARIEISAKDPIWKSTWYAQPIDPVLVVLCDSARLRKEGAKATRLLDIHIHPDYFEKSDKLEISIKSSGADVTPKPFKKPD